MTWKLSKLMFRPERKRQIGLKEDETSIINTLPAAMIEEFSDVLNGNTDLDDEEDFLPDLGDNQTQLDKLLTHHNFKLLEKSPVELQSHNELKWNCWTVEDLFPNLLQNPHNLMKQCVVKDLEVIGRVLHSYTGHSFFSSSYNKAKNANIIGKAFESTDLVEEFWRNGKTVPQLNPLSLLDLCKNKILQNDYVVQSLHISYARVLHMFQKGGYLQSSTINLKATIRRKLAGLPNEQMDLFCYPEYNSQCNQLEPQTLDYSHILTNICTHICSKGYDFCPKEHFLELCEE